MRLRPVVRQIGRAFGHVAARVALAPVVAWRYGISPMLPPSCRYAPSCSAYAQEAIRLHGALRGSALALRRIGRCHPWCAGGWDPVPPAPSSRS